MYNTYSAFLKERFGEKVYKLPIKLDITCPNRDGTLGHGGCIFCSEEGGSFENACGSIKEQVKNNMDYIGKKYGAKKFISYFQNFTNTYMSFESFKEAVEASLTDGIVGINISTRPDCLFDEHLKFLKSLSRDYMITLELGLQTANYHTLKKINRGHGLSEYIDAAIRAHENNLRICTHVIIGLPWDNRDDVIETAKILNSVSSDEVKIHALFIMPGTIMGRMYENGELELISLEEYKDLTIDFLRHLKSDIVVERIIGRAPESALFCNWNTSWWKIRDEIVETMKAKNFSQGDLERKKHDQIYIRGKGLRKN